MKITNENCFICKFGINLKKDDFIEIQEFTLGKYYKSLFAHKTCWLGHMSNKAIMQKSLLNINKMMDKIS